MLNFAQQLQQFLNPRQALALTLVGYELYELSLTCPWVGRAARWGIIGAALWPDIVEAVADARESFTVTPPAATAKDAVVRAEGGASGRRGPGRVRAGVAEPGR